MKKLLSAVLAELMLMGSASAVLLRMLWQD